MSALLPSNTCQSGFHTQRQENILGLAFSQRTSFSLPFPPEKPLVKVPACAVSSRQQVF